MRQKLVGGATQYGLVQVNSEGIVTPRPDFYAAFLFKKLMSEKVLDVAISGADADMIRVYAHCTTSYAQNHVTLLLLNLSEDKRRINFSEATELSLSSNGNRRVWQLTNSVSGLAGYDIQLNGSPLQIAGSALCGVQDASTLSELTLEPLSVSFIVIPASEGSACSSMSGSDENGLCLLTKQSSPSNNGSSGRLNPLTIIIPVVVLGVIGCLYLIRQRRRNKGYRAVGSF
eukprot:TRINITY_DN7634_c0_g3_i1.p1 TRINITY_DN7634_c0_g3~~TRINITY_DN7634_c0_g3_i1.p1  ORF type:complete len:230 (-),score=57.58 TRINITY_DN7634_c0_g3_i1:134-823(-)